MCVTCVIAVITIFVISVLLIVGAYKSLVVTPVLTLEDREDIDKLTCEQMRESGWSEQEIKEFMLRTNGFYSESLYK